MHITVVGIHEIQSMVIVMEYLMGATKIYRLDDNIWKNKAGYIGKIGSFKASSVNRSFNQESILEVDKKINLDFGITLDLIISET